MAGKGEMHMLSAALFLLANSLFLTLRLTGDTGSFPKPLSAGEERMYLERSLAGDLEARNILVEHNLRLVAHIIKKYYTQAAEQEDLISIGTIGLIKAVDTFRPERKIRLATYASRCVENEVLMYFRSRKKLQGEVSLSDTIEPDAAGGALSLMDVVGCDDTLTYYFYYTETVAAPTENVVLPVLFNSIKVPEWATGDQLKALQGFEINVVAEAIQADGFENAAAAWAEFK